MARLTLKNLPAEVLRRLKARALRHGRGLNGEAIACLRAAVSVEPIDAEELLAKARAHRAAMNGPIGDDVVRALKREGRV